MTQSLQPIQTASNLLMNQEYKQQTITQDLLELTLTKHHNNYLIQADNVPSNIRPAKIIKKLKYYHWRDIEKLIS